MPATKVDLPDETYLAGTVGVRDHRAEPLAGAHPQNRAAASPMWVRTLCFPATGVDCTAGCAASDMSPGSSADASSGAAFPASGEVSSGAAGTGALTGEVAVVQRWAHDMASLQYQRMSVHA